MWESRLVRFPRAVDNEGNLVLVFLVVHQTGISTALLSCASPLVKAGKQLALGRLHRLGGGGVTLGSGHLVQGLDGKLRLQISGDAGQAAQHLPGRRIPAVHSLLFTFTAGDQLGLPTRSMKV